MDISNIDYITDIFRTLTGELPETMLYREDEGSMELKTLESTGRDMMDDLLSSGWDLIGTQVTAAA